MNILNNERLIMPFIAGAGNVTKGDLVVYSAGTVVRATDPVSTNTLVGIATESKLATAVVMVDVITSGTTVQAVFGTGGVKKSFADTDLGLVYDLANATTVDLDDTTGGCAIITGYDNDLLEVRFVVPNSLLYI